MYIYVCIYVYICGQFQAKEDIEFLAFFEDNLKLGKHFNIKFQTLENECVYNMRVRVALLSNINKSVKLRVKVH